MVRRMDLRAILYWVTIATLVLSLTYTFVFDIRDALAVGEQSKAVRKALGGVLGLAFLTFMLLNPPD
jgi:hypothetical protein